MSLWNWWDKYKKTKSLNKSPNINTYKARLELIVKEIIYKDEEYQEIMQKLEKFKEYLNIIEIKKENNKIYVSIDNNSDEKNLKYFEKLILSDEKDEAEIEKEGVIEGQGNPISKEEVIDLFKMENSMCKISYENEKGERGKGSGFFCELMNFPIKYALFTNNHVLNESNIEIGSTIYFETCEKTFFGGSNPIKKQIKITENRKVFTNKELDYTCIELLQSDGITNFFRINSQISNFDKTNITKLFKRDIFILQYPKGNELSFSYGKIIYIDNNQIYHTASTESGSSGSPIIIRSKENYIIGLHFGGFKKNNQFRYNLANLFNSILDDIRTKCNKANDIDPSDKNMNEINLQIHTKNDNNNIKYDNNNSSKNINNINNKKDNYKNDNQPQGKINGRNMFFNFFSGDTSKDNKTSNNNNNNNQNNKDFNTINKIDNLNNNINNINNHDSIDKIQNIKTNILKEEKKKQDSKATSSKSNIKKELNPSDQPSNTQKERSMSFTSDKNNNVNSIIRRFLSKFSFKK